MASKRKPGRPTSKRSVTQRAAPAPHAPEATADTSKRNRTRFLLRTVLAMGALYGVYYFPYASDSWPARILTTILAGQAHAAAWLIGLFEVGVRADSGMIQGRFPMQVVKACSSLDAQALFLASVLAFPSTLRPKLVGALLGVVALTTLNVTRIATLYFVGLHAPSWFDTIHEDLFPLILIVAAGAAFATWALWAQRRSVLVAATRV